MLKEVILFEVVSQARVIRSPVAPHCCSIWASIFAFAAL